MGRPTRAAVSVLLCLLLCGPQAFAAEAVRMAAPEAPVPVLPVSAVTIPAGALAAPIGAPQSVVPEVPAAAPAAAQAAAGPYARPAAPKSLIGRLREAIPLLAPKDAGAEDQKGAAESSFLYKAFGLAGARKGETAPAPARRPRKEGSSSGGQSGSQSGGQGDDGGGPDYPRTTVTFRGDEYPGEAFRPNVPVEPLIIRAIDKAEKSIHIAVYEFKLTGVLEALQRARSRGVQVNIVIDYSQVYPEPQKDYTPTRSREIWGLLRDGFNVKVLRGLGPIGINHNKFCVVDYEESESLAEYGSYNWSWSAETSHYENANFTTAKDDVENLMRTWKWLDSQAQDVYEHLPNNKLRVKGEAEFQWTNSAPPPPELIGQVTFNDITLPAMVLSPDLRAERSIEDHLVRAVNAARKSIDISIFTFRSPRLAQALLAAHRDPKRKVAVRVIIDEGQSKEDAFRPFVEWFAFHGIPVKTLSGPDPNSDFPLAQKNHNKFAIFDGKLVETGSANYTKSAAKTNFENAHFIVNPTKTQAFGFSFEHMWLKAKEVEAPAAEPALPTDEELEAGVRLPIPPRQPAVNDWPAPTVQPGEVTLNGETFPDYALRPDTPIQPLIIKAIKAAKKSIRIAAYEFTAEPILEALREARKNNPKLKIEIVMDRSHVFTTGISHTGLPRVPSEQVQALVHENFDIKVLKGKKSGIQHNKYLLVDAEDIESGGGLLFFGSYNFSKTAEENHFEAVKITNQRKRLEHYLAYFDYKRGLAPEFDHEKFEEMLHRTLTEAAAEDAVQKFVEEGFDPETTGSLDGLTSEEAQRLESHLDGDFDPDEGRAALDSALSRHNDEAQADVRARRSEVPPPPEDLDTPIEINGERFQLDYFSPQGGIEQAWVRAIGAARASIEVAMFSFWSKPIADALVAARQARPDLKIRLVLDAGQAKLAKIDGVSVADWMVDKGFDVKLLAGPNRGGDPMLEKQHSKFLLIDGKWLLMGSFNLSPNAENNSFENENVIDDPADVAGFVDFFARMFQRGWPLRPRKPKPQLAAS